MKKICFLTLILIVLSVSSFGQNEMYRRVFEIMMNYQKINKDVSLTQKVYTLQENSVNGSEKTNTTISVYSKDGKTQKIKEENITGNQVVQRIYYFDDDALASVTEIFGEVQDSIATFNYGEPLIKEKAEYFFLENKLYESRLNPTEDGSKFSGDFDPFKKEKELLNSLNKIIGVINSRG